MGSRLEHPVDLEVMLLAVGTNHFTYEAERMLADLRCGRRITPHPQLSIMRSGGFFHVDVSPVHRHRVMLLEARPIFGTGSLVLARGASAFIYLDSSAAPASYARDIGIEVEVALAAVSTGPLIDGQSREDLAYFDLGDAPDFDRPHRQGAVLDVIEVHVPPPLGVYHVHNPVIGTEMDLYFSSPDRKAGNHVFSLQFYLGRRTAAA